MFMNAAEREQPPSPARAQDRVTDSRSPFVRLRELLGDAPPGKPAISLAVGEPQHHAGSEPLGNLLPTAPGGRDLARAASVSSRTI